MALPTRRNVLEMALLAGAVVPMASLAPPPARAETGSVANYLPAVRALRDEVRTLVRAWGGGEQLVRPDGFVYAVDVAQLMACFVDAADRDGYGRMRDHAVRHLVRDDKSDPFTRGFVLWRHNPADKDPKPDASGTTEALRLARALWLGAAAFDRPEDRELALVILRGYLRHETVDQGVWMIRNYFGFGTRSFANNSYLVDYDPDFVRDVADATGDAELSRLADRSRDAVRGAGTPAGLLYDLIQPELKTMYPLLDSVVTFSPNDVVQLSNGCTVALTVTRTAPEVGRRLLAFVTKRLGAGGNGASAAGTLRMYHYGRTGEAVNDTLPNINEWSTLTRLAASLGDKSSAAVLLGRALPSWDYYYTHFGPTRKDAFVASEALAAMSAVLSM
jgi:hypothetical protein